MYVSVQLVKLMMHRQECHMYLKCNWHYCSKLATLYLTGVRLYFSAINVTRCSPRRVTWTGTSKRSTWEWRRSLSHVLTVAKCSRPSRLWSPTSWWSIRACAKSAPSVEKSSATYGSTCAPCMANTGGGPRSPKKKPSKTTSCQKTLKAGSTSRYYTFSSCWHL